MNINVIDFKAIRKEMPKGWIKELSEKNGFNRNKICNVLNGQSKDIEVLTAIADYINEFKTKERKAVQTIKEAINPETSEQLATRLQFQREKYGEGTSPIL